MGVWGLCPLGAVPPAESRGRAEPLVGIRGANPPEAESYLL